MKKFNGGWFFILFICSFSVHANDGLDVIDCSLRESTSCDAFLKMERNVNEVSYKVELVDWSGAVAYASNYIFGCNPFKN